MVVYYSNPKKLRHMVSVMSLQNKSSNNLKNNKTYRTKFCLVKQNRKHSKYIAFFFFYYLKFNSIIHLKGENPVIISIVTKKAFIKTQHCIIIKFS